MTDPLCALFVCNVPSFRAFVLQNNALHGSALNTEFDCIRLAWWIVLNNRSRLLYQSNSVVHQRLCHTQLILFNISRLRKKWKVFEFIGLWIGSTSAEVLLALNRCLHFIAPELVERLFGSKESGSDYKTWIWLLLPTAWMLFYFFFGTPAIFSGLLHVETFNPHFGYANEMKHEVVYFSS